MKRILLIVLAAILILGGTATYLAYRLYSGKAPEFAKGASHQFWEADAYDYLIEADGEKAILYNQTKTSILPVAYGHFSEDGTLYIDKLHGNPLFNMLFWKTTPMGRFEEGTLTDDYGFVKHFTKQSALPNKPIHEFTKDPVQNFEVFWQIFDENYSSFEVSGVQWDKMYRDFRPQVTKDTTEKELKSIFREMIRQLHDGHTQVITGMSAIASKEDNDERQQFYEKNGKAIDKNRSLYFPEPLKTEMDGKIRYGLTAEGVGYVAFKDFQVYDMHDVNAALDRVSEALRNNKGVITDLRRNTGGSDAFRLAAAARFADKKTLALYKAPRNGPGHNDFDPPTPIYIQPAEQRIPANKIAILTSKMTVSAGETAALAFSQLPNATIIGEPTAGYFSDMLFNILPNQWIVTLSSERYTSADGINYEQKGVQPDEIVKMTASDLENGKDPVLERALERLK